MLFKNTPQLFKSIAGEATVGHFGLQTDQEAVLSQLQHQEGESQERGPQEVADL